MDPFGNRSMDNFRHGSMQYDNGAPYIVKLLNLPLTADNGFIEDLFASRYTKFLKFKILVDTSTDVLRTLVIKKVAFVELSSFQDMQKSLKWNDLYYKGGRRVLIELANFGDFQNCIKFNEVHHNELSEIEADFLAGKIKPNNGFSTHHGSMNHNYQRGSTLSESRNNGGFRLDLPLEKGIETPKLTNQHKKPNPFGAAKPVDTLAKDNEIDKKLVHINPTTIRTINIEDENPSSLPPIHLHSDKQASTGEAAKDEHPSSSTNSKYKLAPIPQVKNNGKSLAELLSVKPDETPSPKLNSPKVSNLKPIILKKKPQVPAKEKEVEPVKIEEELPEVEQSRLEEVVVSAPVVDAKLDLGESGQNLLKTAKPPKQQKQQRGPKPIKDPKLVKESKIKEPRETRDRGDYKKSRELKERVYETTGINKTDVKPRKQKRDERFSKDKTNLGTRNLDVDIVSEKMSSIQLNDKRKGFEKRKSSNFKRSSTDSDLHIISAVDTELPPKGSDGKAKLHKGPANKDDAVKKSSSGSSVDETFDNKSKQKQAPKANKTQRAEGLSSDDVIARVIENSTKERLKHKNREAQHQSPKPERKSLNGAPKPSRAKKQEISNEVGSTNNGKHLETTNLANEKEPIEQKEPSEGLEKTLSNVSNDSQHNSSVRVNGRGRGRGRGGRGARHLHRGRYKSGNFNLRYVRKSETTLENTASEST